MLKKIFMVASVTAFALTSVPGMTFVAPAQAEHGPHQVKGNQGARWVVFKPPPKKVIRDHRSPKMVVRDHPSPNVMVSDHRRQFIRR